jgi:hypothetical protein
MAQDQFRKGWLLIRRHAVESENLVETNSLAIEGPLDTEQAVGGVANSPRGLGKSPGIGRDARSLSH